MGYYTYYELTVKNQDNTAISEELEAQLTQEIFQDWYAADEQVPTSFLEVIGYDSYKWYDHHDTMRRVAENHPDLWFILEGKGEEYDDVWVKVYHGDKYREKYVEIFYPYAEGMMDDIMYEEEHND